MDWTITHVRMLVSDYSACYEFYTSILGFEPSFGDESSGYADFQTGDVTIALFDASEMADALPGSGSTERGRDQASLVFAVDDVDRMAGELQTAGVQVVAPPTDHQEWGIRTVHARDPDGTLLEFNEPIET